MQRSYFFLFLRHFLQKSWIKLRALDAQSKNVADRVGITCVDMFKSGATAVNEGISIDPCFTQEYFGRYILTAAEEILKCDPYIPLPEMFNQIYNI